MHDFEKCIVINPNYEDLIASYLATKMQICDWDGFDKFLEIIKNNIIKYKAITSPFRTLSIVDSPELHKEAAIIYAESEIPEDNSLGNIILPARNKKIKVGYYSADFHNHATSYLMVEIFELHDKNNFEIIAFSFGPNTNDTMRIRVSNSFDQFYDVSNMSDYEIAKFSRNIGIDIAVDLKGYTEGQRAGIFAKKCAPIQINYLGYPGTMGSDLYDYIIADKKLIPETQIKNYIEKIVFLPDSYQPNDSKKVISARKFSKKELGLPENSFVYCCFNNTYKILPEIFNIWMKILLDVPNSVLWLINDNHISVDNLRKNAIKKNINPERLIFADRIPLDEHLARHKFADLFLDTFPYNAHTTTSDALWACLPVLTISGKSFASRVSASLLTTSGLNNFVTTSFVEYEEKAINLASNQRTLSEARKTLSNQLDNPLFDSKLYTINLEKGYYEIYNNYLLGFKSKHIYV
jgi:predicted O-linked N-acetylglucosamine transferase (SPINDLY family)